MYETINTLDGKCVEIFRSHPFYEAQSLRHALQDVPPPLGNHSGRSLRRLAAAQAAFPPGGDQHAVNPGSPTYPLDVAAAFSDDRKTFTIAVLNPSDTPASINLTISGTRLADQGTLWQMTPDKIDAVIALGKKPEVRVEEKPQGPISSNIVAPPFSVNINSYPVQ